jgi:hypothetical protein
VHNGRAAYAAAESVPELEPPSTVALVAFTLAYTLLAGPVNYVVLRKLDRRELVWLTVPALVLVFTGLAYVTGLQIRGGRAILHRLAAVYVPEDAEVGRVTEVAGLFSPWRTTYDVWVGSPCVCAIRDILPSEAPAQPLDIFAEAQGARIVDLRVDVGGVYPYIVEGYAEVPPVDADLQVVSVRSDRDGLEGRVRNGALPLHGAVLLAGAEEQRLGDLEAGEDIFIQVPLSPGPGDGDLADRILGTGEYRADPSLYRRAQFLQMFGSRDGATLENGVYLVGWAGESPLAAKVVESAHETSALALYVYALPVKGLDTVVGGVQ